MAGSLGLRDQVDLRLVVSTAVTRGRGGTTEAQIVQARDDLTLLSEQELVQRAQSDLLGPEGRSATCVLFGRYQERVYSWCYRHLRDRDRSLEVAQDVFLRAYRHLGSFSAQGSFPAWLFAITRNRCRSALRLPSWLRDEGVDPDSIESPGPSPEDAEIDGETLEYVMDLIREHLEPLEQEAIWLRCAEGMPVEEITRALRIEERSGARAVLQRARRKLRAGIAAHERVGKEARR